MKTATFTSTISPQLLNWVGEHAKKTKRTRRQILESALERYRKESIQAQMKSDFVRVSTDEDTLEMSEWGMGDYSELTR